MAADRLPRILEYLISEVADRDGPLAKVKLVKLVYLADVEHWRHWGKPISGLKWLFYHYGPYALEFEDYLRQIELPDIEVRTGSGHVATTWKVPKNYALDIDPYVDKSEKRTLNRVVDKWAMEDTDTVLDYVYFETEPMQDAVRGEELDFNAIERVDLFVRHEPPSLPEDIAARIRDEIERRRQGRLKRGTQLRAPPSSQLRQAQDELSEEEPETRLPAGEVAIEEATKQRWSESKE